MFKKILTFVGKHIYKIIFLICLYLPYTWFGFNVNLGGDQGNVYLLHPLDYFQNISLKDWYPIGVGYFNPSYFTAPFMLFAGIFRLIPQPIFLLHHLTYSLVIFFSFYYFSKTLEILFKKLLKFHNILISTLYVSSPITSFIIYEIPLYTIFTAPLMVFYIYKFLQLNLNNFQPNQEIKVYLEIFLITFIFSIGLFQVPWILPFILLFIAFFVILLIDKKTPFTKIIFTSLKFLTTVLLASLFWIIPFLNQFLRKEKSIMSAFFTDSSLVNTFNLTVEKLSQFTNIINPFVNMEHFLVYKNFDSPRYELYEGYFSSVWYLNFIIPVIFVLTFGLISLKKEVSSKGFKFIILILIFTILAFSYTVDVPDPNFKDIFLYLGNMIPGFGMFRNFIGKFSLSVATGLFLVLAAASELANTPFKFIKKKPITLNKLNTFLLIILCLVNFYPFLAGKYIDTKIWRSEMGRMVQDLDSDYYELIDYIKQNVDQKYKIANLNINHSGYEVVYGKNKDTKNIFLGNSPAPTLTGHNYFVSTKNISNLRPQINSLMAEKKFEEIAILYDLLGIKYIMLNKQRPTSINYSWFEEGFLTRAVESESFKNEVLGEKIFENEQYSLYKTKLYDNPLVKEHSDIFLIDEKEPEVKNILSLLKIIGPENLILNQSQFENLRNQNYNTKKILKYNIFEDKKERLVEGYDFFSTSLNNYYESTLSLSNDSTLNIKRNEPIKYENPNEADFLEFDLDPNFVGFVFQNTIYHKSELPLNITLERDSKLDQLIYHTKTKDFFPDLDPAKNRIIDCNKYKEDAKISFDYNLKERILKLSALNNHNSCLYNIFVFDSSIKDKKIVSFEFDYKSNNDNEITIEFLNNKDKVVQRKNLNLKKTETKDFSKAGFLLEFPRNSEKFRYFLKSGKSETEANSEYKGLKIRPVYTPKDKRLNVNFKNEHSYLNEIPSLEKVTDLNIQYNDWDLADCQKVNDLKNQFKITKQENQQKFILFSKNLHAACIRSRQEIKPNQDLKINFTAEDISNTQNIVIFINYNNQPRGQDYTRNEIQINPNQKKDISLTISTPKGSNQAVIHFFATPKEQENSFAISHISVKSVPKFMNNIFYIKDPSQTTKTSQISEKPNSQFDSFNEKYKITNLDTNKKSSLITIPQLFDTGWRIKGDENNKPIIGYNLLNTFEKTDQNSAGEVEVYFKSNSFFINFKYLFYIYFLISIIILIYLLLDKILSIFKLFSSDSKNQDKLKKQIQKTVDTISNLDNNIQNLNHRKLRAKKQTLKDLSKIDYKIKPVLKKNEPIKKVTYYKNKKDLFENGYFMKKNNIIDPESDFF